MSVADSCITQLISPSGLSVTVNANGSIARMACNDIAINLFPGNEMEGGCANIYLRRNVTAAGAADSCMALLGPQSRTRFIRSNGGRTLEGSGEWEGLRYSVALVLSADAPTWFWHVDIENLGTSEQQIDLVYAQDLALAPYGATRINEYYVSQYIDHSALAHGVRGCVVASRQNQAASGRYPWSIIGSLNRGVAFCTDALQFYGLAARAGTTAFGLTRGLPGRRLQHEHSLIAIQDESIRLGAAMRARRGFFGSFVADHPSATTMEDVSAVDRALALTDAQPRTFKRGEGCAAVQSLFTAAPLLEAQELCDADLRELFGDERREVETAEGQLLSFFQGSDCHVVLRAKELIVQRPHGHLLRTGTAATPDETALTSTIWMSGVFHSMVTQGHVSINRFLSTTRSYLGLFRSHGQRVFAQIDGAWQLLDVPSAMAMTPRAGRWIYKHAGGTIEVRSAALSNPHELSLELRVLTGTATRFLISHHVALNGDDGSVPGAAQWSQNGEGITVRPAPGSELAQRFPSGDFLIAPARAVQFERVGGDELLYADGHSRQQPYVCVLTAPASAVELRLRGRLIAGQEAGTHAATLPQLGGSTDVSALTLRIESTANPLAAQVERLQHIIPWFIHNALIHYLSPRGLEQFSGGGWGTRDVSQGPVELLLACGHTAPVRDLLLRVFSAQSVDGDWPQWFMFFERERDIRAGDSHGDVVFWPLLALAQYLIASADTTLLDERVDFFDSATAHAQTASVWQHVQRSLGLIGRRTIEGTALAAYGHGDWNDSLQPADPAMREHMCSAWTVTLHRQMLMTLARALRAIGREHDAIPLEENAARVQRDFQRLLVVDGVVVGYALFEGSTEAGNIRYLLHPRDATSGVHYSSLAMIHAVLEGMLTPDQARTHLQLIDQQLTGPDGIRLFDRPMAYHGGPQRFFQRAESATFFGREIGLMYMHAHLRYAQALAYLGEADRFFKALCQANPIGLREIVPQATRRQANCYYSSSDAAFADRREASDRYDRVAAGTIALDGGWRVYSSGAGIAFSLIVRRFLGLSFESGVLEVDPVMPPALSGLCVTVEMFGRALQLTYDVGPAGCAVDAISLNGQPIAFRRGANPYRRGAAIVAKAALLASLREGVNTLEIALGRARN